MARRPGRLPAPRALVRRAERLLSWRPAPRPDDSNLPGSGLAGVHYLREVGDARRLGDAIRTARRVAVIGAGWIGSEVAASAREMGADVVLIDPAPAPLHRVLGDEIGEVFRQLHADHGVQLRLRTGVAELRGTDTVEHVVLSDGNVEAADVVVFGLGVTPASNWPSRPA
jgi:3-phenylpropionate/trans-cinnamate dioxygenase ferredoxin reductase subunit